MPGREFTVEKYLVSGNSILSPGTIGGILTNVPERLRHERHF